MDTPILESKRILLRPLSVRDAQTIYEGWTSDPEVAKFMNWNLHQSAEDTRQWLAAEERLLSSDSHYSWGFVLKENNLLFGSGGLVFNEEQGKYELGYNIMKKYWNQGLTTEACTKILDFAVHTLNIRTFYARHAKQNPASGKVMEKVGFRYQKDTVYSCFDGTRSFEAREYLLEISG